MTSRREPDERYDAVVIGAGITGVHVAREAACRGRSVLLVDKDDFGSGTSSATTKYLHGGIRYLEQLDVAIVRQSLRERRIATLAAPHLVRQTRLLLPVWTWSRPGRWLLRTGGFVYDALSFDRNRGVPAGLRTARSSWLDSSTARRAVPWLEPDDLVGALVVTETLNVHPERLLLEYLFDATALGVTARNHLEVTGLTTTVRPRGGVVVQGVELTDTLDGNVHHVAAGVVINAAGPWVGVILDKLVGGVSRGGPMPTLSKGVHVLTSPTRNPAVLGVDSAVMARGRSGRHVVVSPWLGRELIGPTDTPVDLAPDDVTADAADVAELLGAANACRVQAARLTVDDVEDVTVGIRPLVSASAADTYAASRGHDIHDHDGEGVHGLWSVIGGKWTTGRGVGEDVVDRVFGSASRPSRFPRGSPTRSRPVPAATGWAISPAEVFELAGRYRPDVDVELPVRHHLARLYGVRCTRVLDLVAAEPALGQPISQRDGRLDISAQVVVAVGDEQARTLTDIVDRRLVLGTLGRIEHSELEHVAMLAAPLLGWTEDGRGVANAEFARRERIRVGWRS